MTCPNKCLGCVIACAPDNLSELMTAAHDLHNADDIAVAIRVIAKLARNRIEALKRQVVRQMMRAAETRKTLLPRG
jgi:hypothetical protein